MTTPNAYQRYLKYRFLHGDISAHTFVTCYIREEKRKC